MSNTTGVPTAAGHDTHTAERNGRPAISAGTPLASRDQQP